jgi:hypothetical protein
MSRRNLQLVNRIFYPYETNALCVYIFGYGISFCDLRSQFYFILRNIKFIIINFPVSDGLLPFSHSLLLLFLCMSIFTQPDELKKQMRETHTQ